MIGRGELKSRCGGRLFLLVRILSREDEGVEESCDLDARIGKQDQFFLFFAKRESILSSTSIGRDCPEPFHIMATVAQSLLTN